MKKLLVIAGIALALGACQKSPKGEDAMGLKGGDTIKTPSGLQYFYVKKGAGRKVEKGSAVTSYLSLMVGDKVVWNTDAQPDSLFTYLAGNNEVIKGFEEMGLLLREGDEVVAIIPPHIAYGEGGAGDLIPPNSTIVYNQWRVKNVTEPKLFISDTLYDVVKNNGIEAAIVRYKSIANSQDSTKYFLNDRQFSKLWSSLTADNMHEEAFMAADYFGTLFENNGLKFNAIISLETMGQYKEALTAVDALLVTDPESRTLKAKKGELAAKLVE